MYGLSRRTMTSIVSRAVVLFMSIAASVVAADGPIRVGIYENPPKIFTNADGRPVGIFPELMEDIAAHEGWSLEWQHCIWARCLDLVESGQLDVMVDVAWSEERAERFLYSSESVMHNWATVYTAGDVEVESMLDLAGTRVAVMTQSIHTDSSEGIRRLLDEFDIPVTYVEADSYAGVFDLIDSGAADVGVVNRIFGAMEEHRYRVSRTPIVFNPSQLHFVFPKGKSRSAYLRDAIDRHVRVQKDDPGSVLQQSITYFLSGAVDMRSTVTPLERLRRRVDLDSEEQAWLREHPRIRIGVDPEFAPFEIITEDGRYLGAAADYVRLVGRILGVSMEPVTGISWVEAVERARNREIDVLPAVGISDERRQFLDYSQPYLEFPRVIVTRSDSTVRELEDLAAGRLAVQRDSSHAGFVREMTDLEATYFDTFEQALLSLSRGEVDAVLGNLAVSTHWIRELSLTNLKIAAHVSDTTFPLAFAVRNDWHELRGMIDKALAALSPQDHADIKRRWLPVEVPEPRLADQVMSRLTVAERQWLEEHPRVRVGVPSNDPPYNFRAESGDFRGVTRDYLDRIGEAIGLRFDVEFVLAGESGSDRLEAGDLDLVVTPRYDAENPRGIHHTQIFVPTPLVVITRDREEDINGPADLDSRLVALILDHPDSDRVLAEHPDIEPVMVDSPLDALRAVATGAADAHVGVLGTSIYLAEKHGIVNLKVAAGYEMQLAGERFAVRADWPELAGIIDKSLDAIAEKEHNAIHRKWLPVTRSLPSNDDLRLTQAERVWLAEHPVVRVGTDAGFAPLEFRDRDGRFQGIAVDFLREIEEALGVRFEFVPHETWADVMRSVGRREVDLLISASPTRERREHLSFTEPYLDLPTSIFTGHGISFVSDLGQLEGRKVAVVDGHFMEELLRDRYPSIGIAHSATTVDALRTVARGDADAYVGDTLTTSHLLSRAGLSNIRISGETIIRQKLSMAVRNDWPQFAGILQKALDAIPPETRDGIYRKWTSVAQQQPFDYVLAAQVGGGALLLFAAFVFWNRRLAREVRRREAAERRAQAANEAKSAFLADISHEIRTPMNAILGYAQLLARDESLTSAQRRSLEIIDRSGEHLIELINDVLEMSRIEAGHATVQVDDIDLNDLLESLVAVFGYQASSKQLELSLEIAPDVPWAVRTDGGKLREILLNLISNAIKFTHQGFVRVKAQVSEPGETQLKLRFIVEDSGIGIAAQNVNRIFDAFHRAQDSDRVIEGTGLGLTISQRYAALLGGGLTVESKHGAGSRFQLDISVERGNPERVEAAAQSRAHATLASGQGPFKVLVVDDHEANRLYLSRLLEAVGIEAQRASDGAEAVEAFEQWQPDAILMDLRMPRVDGFEATKRIRKLPGGANVPIVAVTASVFGDEQRRIAEAGMNAFVRKPFRESEIFDQLSHLAGVRFVYKGKSRDAVDADADEGSSDGAREAATPRVMIVDDDEIQRELMSSFVELVGYDCDVASEGGAAFARWQQARHELIITDCNMPGMNGIDLAYAIRGAESGDGPRTVLIALTGDKAGLEAACEKAGIDEVVAKPVNVEVIEALLEQHLGSGKRAVH